MKRTVIILCSAVLAAAALLTVSCKKDSKADNELTPEQVVNNAYNALVAKDYETFVNYTTVEEDKKAALIETLQTKYSGEDSNEITEFSCQKTEIQDDKAEAAIWIKRKDGNITEGTVALVHTDNGWKIDTTSAK